MNPRRRVSPASIKKYYDSEYDYVKDLYIDRKRMDRWLKWVDGKVCLAMLDVGCGVGRTVEWARLRNIKWVGIDTSEKATDLAYSLGRIVMVIDAEDMPYADDIFDIVVALGSIEHMNRPLRALDEMYRVLKPGGKAVILVPNKIALLEKLGLYHGTEQPYEWRWSKWGWTQFIEGAGLTICRIRKDYGPPIFKDWKPHKIIQRALLKLSYVLPDSFTYCWIFDCKKETI